MDTDSNTDGTLLVGATNDSALLLRHDFLTQGRQAVEDFLADLEDTINHDQDRHLLLRNEIDSKIRKLMVTVNEMKAEIALSHTVFTTRCQPILERTLPLPAPIIDVSNGLLRLLEGERKDDDDYYDDDDGVELTKDLTVTQFDMIIARNIKYILDDNVSDTMTDGMYNACLDIDRDTPEEVTNMLKLYPRTMSGTPPKIMTNFLPRSVPFIPTILAVWQKETNNSAVYLARRDGGKSYFRCKMNIAKLVKTPSAVQNKKLYDESCAKILTTLIKQGLFWIADKPLVPHLIDGLIRNGSRFFAEQRFQVLVHHFPSVLDVNDSTGRPTPLQEICRYTGNNMFQSFLSIFKAGIQKLPPNHGILLLFQKLHVGSNKSPYNFLDSGGNIQREEKIRRVQAIEDILNDPAMRPTNPPAPSGWVATWDVMNDHYIYYNTVTRATQCERLVSLVALPHSPLPLSPPPSPPPVPFRWVGSWDAEHRRKYYYNADTRATQWQRPVSLVVPPSPLPLPLPPPVPPLPYGWVETWDATNNRNYYFNYRSAYHYPQLERPVSSVALPPPPTLPLAPRSLPRALAPLPSGWFEIWDATNNHFYYYNAVTRATQWKWPNPPPALYHAFMNYNDMDTHHRRRRPYDPAHTLLVAATSEQIVLDGVYFILRRDPDVLKKLLGGKNDNNRNQNRNKKQKKSHNTERTHTGLHKEKSKTK